MLYGFEPKTVLKIAECESNFDTTAVNYNKNNTIDVSIFQINSIHSERAQQLKLDLTDPFDNIEMAFILLNDNGYKDWSASRKCWLHV